MDQHIGVRAPAEQIEAFCRKWGISELSLFGSVLRADFRCESDVDVLVTFAPEGSHGLFDVVRMQNELKEIFGHDVDMVSRRGIEASRNPIRRKAILDSARAIYERTG
jgi:predicted nucleotidyltransferase